MARADTVQYIRWFSLNDGRMSTLPILLCPLTTDQIRLLSASAVCLGLHLLLFAYPVSPHQTFPQVAMPISPVLSLSLVMAPAVADSSAPESLPSSLPRVDTIPPVAEAVARPSSPPPAVTRQVESKTAAKAKPRPQPPRPQQAPSQPIKQPRQPVASINSQSTTMSPSVTSTDTVMQPRFRVPPALPIYPQAARQRRQEGTVIVEVQLSAAGVVQHIILLRSSGFPLLDRAALQAAQRWQFLSQQINGQGISHTVRIPVRFNLT